jgi:tetratricopeptide (TPR) repeat protein
MKNDTHLASLSVEELQSIASLALENNKPAEALSYILEIRRRAPTSAVMRNAEAWARGKLGDQDQAFDLYRQSHASGDHAAAVDAMCLAALLRNREAAIEFMEAALERTPASAFEIIRGDTFLDFITSEPRIRAAIENARRASRKRRPDG